MSRLEDTTKSKKYLLQEVAIQNPHKKKVPQGCALGRRRFPN